SGWDSPSPESWPTIWGQKFRSTANWVVAAGSPWWSLSLSPKRSPDVMAGSSPSRLRLLLVDDDAYSAKALRLLLTNWGCDVTVAGSIAEAKAALTEGFNHIILDLMLPDGDGAELLRLVRHKNLATKVT